MTLAGKRVLVTRAPQQASELAERLRAFDAIPILIPTIEIGAPTSWAALDGAVAVIEDFDLVAFTSANAVDSFQRRARLLQRTPVPRRVAVVGPATARAVERLGLIADVMPHTFTAESLAKTLAPEASGSSILLVLAEDAPPTLRDALESFGARVTIAPAYRNRIPAGSLSAITALFAESSSHPDAVTFTSASTATNLLALCHAAAVHLPATITRASIGPVTSRTLCELGFPPHIEAAQATIPALASALAAYFVRDQDANHVDAGAATPRCTPEQE